MAGEDPAYLSWLRRQPCALAGSWRGWGHLGVQAHHATAGRGLGQRTHDHTAVPLCFACHEAFHGGREPFGARAMRAAWMAAQAIVHRKRYQAQTVGIPW